MPLAGTEKSLGQSLADAMKSAPPFEDAWMKIATIVIAHVTGNALVTGVAPSGGGPIVEGRIE